LDRGQLQQQPWDDMSVSAARSGGSFSAGGVRAAAAAKSAGAPHLNGMPPQPQPQQVGGGHDNFQVYDGCFKYCLDIILLHLCLLLLETFLCTGNQFSKLLSFFLSLSVSLSLSRV
jgi:hypothetical protein